MSIAPQPRRVEKTSPFSTNTAHAKRFQDAACVLDVRYGSKADISRCNRHVRFTPKSRHVRCNQGQKRTLARYPIMVGGSTLPHLPSIFYLVVRSRNAQR